MINTLSKHETKATKPQQMGSNYTLSKDETNYNVKYVQLQTG